MTVAMTSRDANHGGLDPAVGERHILARMGRS